MLVLVLVLFLLSLFLSFFFFFIVVACHLYRIYHRKRTLFFFFFVSASLEDEIVTVATQDYDLKTITFELGLTPELDKRAMKAAKGKKKENKIFTQLYLGVAQNFSTPAVKNLTMDTRYTRPTYVRLRLELNDGGCDDNKPISTYNATSDQYDYDWCFEIPSVRRH